MQFENNIVCVSMFWKYFFFHTELLKVWISFSQVLGNQPSEGKVSTFSECLQTCNCSLWRTPTNTYSSIEILYYKYILLYWAVLLKNKWYIYALSNDRVFLFSSLNWKVPLPHMLCSSMCYLSCGSQQWYKGNFCWKLFLGLFYRIVFTLVYNLLPEQEKKLVPCRNFWLVIWMKKSALKRNHSI